MDKITNISFFDRQPIYKVEKDCIINKSGDITVGYELHLPEVFTLSGDEYNMLHQTVNNALAILPDYTVVHKQDWFLSEKYNPCEDMMKSEDNPSFLQKKFFSHFSERPVMNHKCFLYISKSCQQNMQKKSGGTQLLNRYFVPKEMLDEKTITVFLDAAEQFAQNLRATKKIKVKRLTTDDIVGSPGKFGILDKYWSLHEPSDVLKDIVFDSQNSFIGDNYLAMHTISDIDGFENVRIQPYSKFKPLSTDRTECNLSFTYPVGLNLSCNHVYNQYIFLFNSKSILNKLLKASKHMGSFSSFSAANVVNKHFNEQFISECELKGTKAVRFHANVMSWSNDRAEIAQIKTDVGAAINQLGYVPRYDNTSLPFLLWAGCPGNAADFPYEDTIVMTLPQTTCFWSMETCHQNSPSTFGIKLVDRFTGRPLHVDISEYPMTQGIITNRNKVIIGPSGSGKSFFTNLMVSQYYEQGAHVVLVDIGHSYSGLCRIINKKTGGQDGIYMTHSNEKPLSFNPFYTDDGIFETGKINSIIALLTSLWKKSWQKTTRNEDVFLDAAVKFYIEKIIKEERPGSFNEFYEFVTEDFVAEAKRQKLVLKDEFFNVAEFTNALRPFYKGGTYEYLLNSTEELDLLGKRFVVFELDNIKDDDILLMVCTVVIMEAFINKMRRGGIAKKMILLEEVWKVLATDTMAEYVKYLFKTVRKHEGEAIVVTQEVDDIVGNAIVKNAIVNNSDCKILLDSRKYMKNFDSIANLLGLTDKQCAQILSINKNNKPGRVYREVFIGLGDESAVYAVEVSMEQYYTFTTNKKEKVMVEEEAKRCGGDYELAVSNICAKIREKLKKEKNKK